MQVTEASKHKFVIWSRSCLLLWKLFSVSCVHGHIIQRLNFTATCLTMNVTPKVSIVVAVHSPSVARTPWKSTWIFISVLMLIKSTVRKVQYQAFMSVHVVTVHLTVSSCLHATKATMNLSTDAELEYFVAYTVHVLLEPLHFFRDMRSPMVKILVLKMAVSCIQLFVHPARYRSIKMLTLMLVLVTAANLCWSHLHQRHLQINVISVINVRGHTMELLNFRITCCTMNVIKRCFIVVVVHSTFVARTLGLDMKIFIDASMLAKHGVPKMLCQMLTCVHVATVHLTVPSCLHAMRLTTRQSTNERVKFFAAHTVHVDLLHINILMNMKSPMMKMLVMKVVTVVLCAANVLCTSPLGVGTWKECTVLKN